MKRHFLLLGLLTLFSSTLQLQAANWTASWIGVADAPAANQWIALRKNVSLDQQPKSAQARIAADSKYWLWINGKLVVFEGQLKRGPNPNDT